VTDLDHEDYGAPVPGGCIFCGGTPLTREHLWPDWLGRELQIREPFSIRIEQEKDGVETRDISFQTPPFDQTVRAVCEQCNSTWMSDMEADAKPILWALSHAEGRSLDGDEQRVLARWALLKACVFDEVHPNERVVPVAHRQHLYEHKDPPGDGLWVLLATYEAEELRHYAYQGLLLGAGDGPAPTAPTVYFVTITIGALVVQIIGSVLPAWSLRGVSVLEDELGVVPVWPTSLSVEFEQRKVLRHEDMLRFTQLLYNVVARLSGGAPPAR
jgi:hypothetical protein